MTDKLIEQTVADTETKVLVDSLCRGACWANLDCKKAAKRILADAEVIKAAEGLLVKRLKALQTYFDLSDEELESMTRDERADTIRQHRLITEALDDFYRAMQSRAALIKENNDEIPK